MVLLEIIQDTESVVRCTKLRKYANYGRAGTKEKIRAGYTFAIEPMLNLGTHETKTLADKWTVITLDGKPSAHAEHTIAVTEEGPEILTLTKEQKSQLKQTQLKPCQLNLKSQDINTVTLLVCQFS